MCLHPRKEKVLVTGAIQLSLTKGSHSFLKCTLKKGKRKLSPLIKWPHCWLETNFSTCFWGWKEAFWNSFTSTTPFRSRSSLFANSKISLTALKVSPGFDVLQLPGILESPPGCKHGSFWSLRLKSKRSKCWKWHESISVKFWAVRSLLSVLWRLGLEPDEEEELQTSEGRAVTAHGGSGHLYISTVPTHTAAYISLCPCFCSWVRLRIKLFLRCKSKTLCFILRYRDTKKYI